MNGTADRLVAIARQILLAEGAAAVSMRRVATAAGVTPMAIYRHLANRDALLSTIVEAGFAEIAARWAQRPPSDDFDASSRMDRRRICGVAVVPGRLVRRYRLHPG